MIRATTPTHVFTFPYDISPAECTRILITYAQGRQIMLEFEKDELTIDGQNVSHKFTQEEANVFSAMKKAEIQIRILMDGGEALASNVITVKVDDVLNDEVLV